MSRGINKVILVGRLGNDPDVRYTASGSQVTNISVATTESWKDRNTGQQQERTEWHRVVFFGRLAEIAGQYLRKGSQVYVEGSLRTNKYTDRNGIERYSTDINANELQMLGGGGGGGGNWQSNAPGNAQGFNNDPYDQSAPAYGGQQNQGGQNWGAAAQSTPSQPQGGGFQNKPAAAEDEMPDFDTFDDDIPF